MRSAVSEVDLICIQYVVAKIHAAIGILNYVVARRSMVQFLDFKSF